MESLEGLSSSPAYANSLDYTSLPPDILTSIFMEIVFRQVPSSLVKIKNLKLINKTHNFNNDFIKYLSVLIGKNNHFQAIKDPILALLKEKILLSDILSEASFKLFDQIIFDTLKDKEDLLMELIKAKDNSLALRLLTNSHFNHDLAPSFLLKATCEHGNLTLLKFVVEHFPIDPSLEKNNALVFSAKNGHADIVAFLIRDQRTDPTDQNHEAIKQAAAHNRGEVLRVLLKDGRADPTAEDHYVMKIAIQEGFTDIVALLLKDERIDPQVDDNIFIKFAIFHYNEELTNFFLDYVDPNLIFLDAIRNGSPEILQLFLADSRLDLPTQGTFPLEYACERGNLDILKPLLKATSISPAFDNNYLIRWASYYGHESIIEYLLTLPEVDQKAYQYEAIRAASSNGHQQVVKLLVNSENVNLALEEACRQQQFEIINLLLKFPQVDLIPSLQSAIKNNHLDVCYKLLSSSHMPVEYKQKYAKYWKFYE